MVVLFFIRKYEKIFLAMIITLTMNPCIDVTDAIGHFEYGGMNRVVSRRVDCSGKGINVALVLKHFGVDARAIGMNYTGNGDGFCRELSKLGLDYEAVFAEGNVRENIKILDLEKAVTTEVNQNGVPMDEDTLHKINDFIDEVMSGDVDTFVMTGSLPPGTPIDFYKKLIEKGKARGIRMMLDAEGDYLTEGIKAGPYLIKPNLFEFVTAFNPKDESIEELIATSKKIIDSGVKNVCISMGEDGALIIDKDDAFICRPVACDVASTQGAGDSLMAGICMALKQNLSLNEQLKWGVACSLGSVTKEGTLLCEMEDFEKFYSKLEVLPAKEA